jgi:alpha/beta superfamily hydrolase
MPVVTEAVRFPSGELTLVGVLHRPQGTGLPAVAVCHPHPLYGGDMENNVVVSLCGALADAGVAALRFNFRGVGGSGGSHGGGIGERQDALAALDFLAGVAGVDGGGLGLAGYSFGALVALGAADERACPSGPPVRQQAGGARAGRRRRRPEASTDAPGPASQLCLFGRPG